jgi:hypothetical protein
VSAGQAGLPFARHGAHRIAVAIEDIEPGRAGGSAASGTRRSMSVRRPVSASRRHRQRDQKAMAKGSGSILMDRP